MALASVSPLAYAGSPYFRVGKASDLSGRDKALYRCFEILPGALSWLTILGTVLFSYFLPTSAAFFVIAFNLYWVCKSLYLSVHLRINARRLKGNLSFNWVQNLSGRNYVNVLHLVILPFYKEGIEIVEKSVASLLEVRYDPKRIAVVLAAEERAGESSQAIARTVEQRYGSRFGYFLVTIHPQGLQGELAGKGSNSAYAAERALKEIVLRNGIRVEDVLVSALDIDTVVYPDYFLCLTYNFLSSPTPYRHSYQPVPLYNNNIWQAPSLSRVVAVSGSFWQMIQQERPERLTTFSSHSMTLRALIDVGFWQTNIVSEDSRIFWNAFFAYDGQYEVRPLSYPVSMDANLAPTFFETLRNIYKQQRRWSWGAENLPYIFMGFVKNKAIPSRKKWKVALVELERAWSLATNPLLLFLLSWFPLMLGGRLFNTTILSYNLPLISKYIGLLGLIGLFASVYISLRFLPQPPEGYTLWRRASMVLQWLLIPVTLIFFGALPALEAQTRLMIGRYMGFWVTPKHRRQSSSSPANV